LPQFCKCGSIIINGKCSNKSCKEAINAPIGTKKAESEKKKNQSPPAAEKPDTEKNKPAKKRRASKCITYSLEELEKRENVKY